MKPAPITATATLSLRMRGSSGACGHGSRPVALERRKRSPRGRHDEIAIVPLLGAVAFDAEMRELLAAHRAHQRLEIEIALEGKLLRRRTPAPVIARSLVVTLHVPQMKNGEAVVADLDELGNG